MKTNNRTIRRFNRQAGYSLPQVLMAITLASIFGMVTVKAGIDAINDAKSDELITEVSLISTAMVKCAKLKGGSFATCNMEELDRLGLLDDESWGDGTGVNPYSGNYTTSMVTGDPNSFIVSATSISSDQHCARLEAAFTRNAKAVDCTSGTLAVTQGTD